MYELLSKIPLEITLRVSIVGEPREPPGVKEKSASSAAYTGNNIPVSAPHTYLALIMKPRRIKNFLCLTYPWVRWVEITITNVQ